MKNELYPPHTSSIGNLNANVAALLSYVGSVVISWIPGVRYAAWLVPLAFFLLEKQSKFVKFHAMQSFLLHLVSAVLTLIVTLVSSAVWGLSTSLSTYYYAAGMAGIFGVITLVISLVILVFAVIAMVGAYQYKETHIPLLGTLAARLAAK